MSRQKPTNRRWLLALALFAVLTILGRTDAVRTKVGELPTALLALPVLLLGLASIALGVGPTRRLEKEAQKARQAPVPPGTSQLGAAPTWLLRTFLVAGGLGIAGLAVWGLSDAYG